MFRRVMGAVRSKNKDNSFGKCITCLDSKNLIGYCPRPSYNKETHTGRGVPLIDHTNAVTINSPESTIALIVRTIISQLRSHSAQRNDITPVAHSVWKSGGGVKKYTSTVSKRSVTMRCRGTSQRILGETTSYIDRRKWHFPGIARI